MFVNKEPIDIYFESHPDASLKDFIKYRNLKEQEKHDV